MQKLASKVLGKGYSGSKNRDRLSIVAAVLEAADSGVSKTRIMLSVGLSSTQLNKYLKVVCDCGFVENESVNWITTKNGHEFLKKYKEFEMRYSSGQKLFEALSNEREQFIRKCDPKTF